MSKITILFVFVSIIFVSCQSKLDLVEEGPSVPIIYAIFDHNDTVHYVRINKSFNGNIHSYDMAKHSDSILYNQPLDIKAYVLNNSNNIVKTLTFSKENLKKDSVNTEGMVVFAVDKHYVYVSKDGKLPMGVDYVYKLELKIDDTLIAWATTNALYGFSYYDPATNVSTQLLPSAGFISTGWYPHDYAGLVYSHITVYYYEYNKKENRYYVKSIKRESGNVAAKAGTAGFQTSPIIEDIMNQIDATDTPDIERRYICRMTIDYLVANIDYTMQMSYYGSLYLTEFDYASNQPLTNIVGGFGLFGARMKGKNEDRKSVV